MATTRANRVEVEIVAKDEATPTITRLEKKIDGLEADEARIIVTASTDRLEDQLQKAKTKIDGLEGDELTVQLTAVGNLEAELDQAQSLLAQLDGKTGTVHLNAVDTTSGDIDRVDQKRRDLDGKTATVKLDSTGTLGAVGAAAGAAGIGAAITDAVISSEQLAIQVAEVAKATGAPLEQASRLVAVWRQNGFEVGDLLELLAQVNGALAQNPDLAKKLGVELGGNQNLIDQFLTTVEGVGTKFDSIADQQNAAAALFGETGQVQINRLELLFGSLADQIRSVPEKQLIDQGDVDRAKELNVQMVEFKGHLTEIQNQLTEGIIPLLNQSIDRPGSFGSILNTALISNPITAPTAAFLGLLDRNQQNAAEDRRSVISDAVLGAVGARPIDRDQHGLAPRITIVNAPGTPPTVVNAERIYQRRNGAS